MSGRIQLALNVDDLGESIAFYSKLFGAGPAKVKPGYANFAIAEPPLKLVLLENPGQGGSQMAHSRSLMYLDSYVTSLVHPCCGSCAAGTVGREPADDAGDLDRRSGHRG